MTTDNDTLNGSGDDATTQQHEAEVLQQAAAEGQRQQQNADPTTQPQAVSTVDTTASTGLIGSVEHAVGQAGQQIHDAIFGHDAVGEATGHKFYSGLDADTDLRPFLPLHGFDFCLRYSKNYSLEEHTALTQAGLKCGIIFEVRGIVTGGLTSGQRDAREFLQQITNIGISPGPRSAVFAACDEDLTSSQLAIGEAYFQGFGGVVQQAGWQLGSYAPGALLQLLGDTVIPWSAGAKSWNATESYDESLQWIISQGPPQSLQQHWSPGKGKLPGLPLFQWPAIAGLDYDPNIAQTLDWAL